MTFGWIVVVPVLYAIATLALTLRWARRDAQRTRHVAVDPRQTGVMGEVPFS